MLIYEVNLEVDLDAVEQFEQWLYLHIEEILELEGFIRADLNSVIEEDQPTGKKYWSVHYYIDSRASLENYYSNHAPRMREQGLNKFGGRFSATRRVLEVSKQFTR